MKNCCSLRRWNCKEKITCKTYRDFFCKYVTFRLVFKKFNESAAKDNTKINFWLAEKELKNKPVNHASFISGSIQGYIDLEGLIDPKDEIKRLTKDLKKIQVALMGLEKKLGNNQFLSQAPKDIVKGVKQKRDDLKGEAAHLLSQIQRLKNSK